MRPTDTDRSKVQRAALLALIAVGPALAVAGGIWWTFLHHRPKNDLDSAIGIAVVPYIATFIATASLSALKPHTSKDDVSAAQLLLLVATVSAVIIGTSLATPLLAAMCVGGAFGANSAIHIMRDQSPAYVFKNVANP